jgi:DNA-binding NarL/FixJ family response regulator
MSGLRRTLLGNSDMSILELKCFVADDHPAMLEAVCAYLTENGVEVVGRARRGRDALERIQALEPPAAVVDLGMPELSGIEIARELRRTSPETAVILYTGSSDQALLSDAVDAGARGFVLKEAPLSDLVRALETVSAGGTYVDPVLAGALTSAQATGKLVQLTERERDVLRLLADGLRYEEIGKRLMIAPETVRTHVRNAMRRLEAETYTQAVATALRQSLIS